MLPLTGRQRSRTEPCVCINQRSQILIFPHLLLRSSISRTIRMYDMPTMRIRRYWPSESRLGRLAMDLASSVSVPLSAVPPEISRLVLESLMPPAPSRRSTVGRRSVDESLLVPLRAFFSLRIAGFTSTDLLLVIGKQWATFED